eukprot:TCALIF_14030-PA protein Name:"Protein of unknown function" AED:0.25 eAED:0.53 QI:2/0/0/1/0/0/2/0/209
MLSIIRDVFFIPEDTDLTVDEVLDSVRSHLRSRHSINVDWYELLTCKQHSHERVSSFLARLRCQAKYIRELNFDTLIQACLILGIRDNDARSKVLSSSPAIESTQEDLKLIHTEDPCYVDAINKQTPTSRALNNFKATILLLNSPLVLIAVTTITENTLVPLLLEIVPTVAHQDTLLLCAGSPTSTNITRKYSQNFPSLATIADESSGH